MSDMTIEDIDESIKSKVYAQDYSKKQTIEGVKMVTSTIHVGEEGDFEEILRIKDGCMLEQFPGFQLAQVNRTYLFPDSIKAWHFHLKQDEIWYLPPNKNLFVGLWDIRKNSPTKNVTMRIVLGGGKSSLLYIPKGVAHGSANFSRNNANLFYFVNKQFDIDNPDEMRINWDAKGADFWQPVRD